MNSIKILEFSADEIDMSNLNAEEMILEGEINGVDFSAQADFKIWKTFNMFSFVYAYFSLMSFRLICWKNF